MTQLRLRPSVLPDVSNEAGFRVAATRPVSDFGFLALEELEIEASDGRRATRLVVRHPGAVGILAVVDDGVVLIRQYRAPLDVDLLEIPAGKLDVVGEPPEATAARELEEEIGYRAEQLTLIADVWTAPGFADERMYIYFAEGLTPVPMEPHGLEEEASEIVRVPVDELYALLASGEVRDAKTMIALQWLVARGR